MSGTALKPYELDYEKQKEIIEAAKRAAYGTVTYVDGEDTKAAIKNAYANYDRNIATYGRNAEALAQNGLVNSGYSDYMNGVAHANLVGSVSAAYAKEQQMKFAAAKNDAALRNAADMAYYSALSDLETKKAEAEKAYKDNYKTALELAGSGGLGTMTQDEIKKAYGLSDEDALEIFNRNNIEYQLKADAEAAYLEEQKMLENQQQQANIAIFETYLNGYKNDYDEIVFLDEKDLRAYAYQYGITDEDTIQKYIEQNNANKTAHDDKVLYDSALSQITAETTDAYIDSLDFYQKGYKYKLKQERNKLFIENTLKNIEAGVTSNGEVEFGDLSDVDEMYENGKGSLSLEDVQQCYFAYATKWIHEGIDGYEDVQKGLDELERLKINNKISEKDYNNLTKYLLDNQIDIIPGTGYYATKDETLDSLFGNPTSDSGLRIKTKNKEFKVCIRDISEIRLSDKDKKMISLFEDYETNENTLAKIGNKYVIYVDGKWKMLMISSSVFSDYKNEFDSMYQVYKKEITKPQHTKD